MMFQEMNIMKKTIAILLAAVMLLACLPAFAEGDQVKLTFQRIGSDAAESAYWAWVIEEFEKETGIKVNYTTYETNEDLYNMLKNSNVSYDVIVPS